MRNNNTIFFLIVLFIFNNFYFNEANAKIITNESAIVSKKLFLDNTYKFQFDKKLDNDFTGATILLLIPNSNKHRINDLTSTYKELGCKQVFAIVPPKYPTTAYIDSVQQFCADSNVKLIAQFSFSDMNAPFFAINFSKLKNGDNIIVLYTGWNPEEKKYFGNSSFGLGQTRKQLMAAFKKMMPTNN